MIYALILAAALDSNSVSALQPKDSTYEKIEQWIDTTMNDEGSDNYDRQVSKDFLRLKYGRHQSPVAVTFYWSPWATADVVLNESNVQNLESIEPSGGVI